MIAVGDRVRNVARGKSGEVTFLHDRGGTIVPVACRVRWEGGDGNQHDATITELVPERFHVKVSIEAKCSGGDSVVSYYVQDGKTNRTYHKTYSGQNWKAQSGAQKQADRLNVQSATAGF